MNLVLLQASLSPRGADKRRKRAIVFAVVVKFVCSCMCCGDSLIVFEQESSGVAAETRRASLRRLLRPRLLLRVVFLAHAVSAPPDFSNRGQTEAVFDDVVLSRPRWAIGSCKVPAPSHDTFVFDCSRVKVFAYRM
jgi:hypothetical protein